MKCNCDRSDQPDSIIYWRAREAMTEKVTLHQRPEGAEGVTVRGNRRKSDSKHTETSVQRP